jgi:hypothetical protein
VANKTGATRLGFALLLKFLELNARFRRVPRTSSGRLSNRAKSADCVSGSDATSRETTAGASATLTPKQAHTSGKDNSRTCPNPPACSWP